MSEPVTSVTLGQIASVFLRLGVTAFGGPAAHIAMMQDEVVTRRRWLSQNEFLDLLGAANLIPGPNSTELAIHIGYRRGGIRGLLVAGVCFIVPAALITLAFAVLYVRWGSLPRVAGVLYGIKPVVVAIVVQALVALARTAIPSLRLRAIFACALIGAALRAPELALLLAGGLCAAITSSGKRNASAALVPFALGAGVVKAAVPVSTVSVLLAFAKIGSVLYGSGYVLLAFLRSDLVIARGWITEAQLADAIAVGQFTPGPVFTTATFVGYLVDGASGAAAATVGIFAPAFVLVALSGAIVPRIRRSKWAGHFLDGVNVASLALMTIVTIDLARGAFVDVAAVVIAIAASALLFTKTLGPTALLAVGATTGIVLRAYFA